MEVNPLSIILVKAGSKGDRLLFRYPYHEQESNEPANTKRKNPYALVITEDLLQSPPPPTSNINKGSLTGISDEVLSSLFAVKQELCNQKFELKINDVRFVGHPTSLRNKSQDDAGVLLIHIVFALQALASHSIVKCYHDLSKRLGIVLRHEEHRCGYIAEETLSMVSVHDDSCTSSFQFENPFKNILENCALAKNLKKVYDDLCSTGLVSIRINKWIPLTFCLPQKMHQWHLRGKIVEPEDIDRCLKALRPFHSLLLLYPVQQLYDFTSLDGSPSLIRMFSQYSPLKSLQTLAIDSDITLSHVFELTAHLVYWAKATVIYPICSTNKYTITQDAQLHLNSSLLDKFSDAFPGMDLIQEISDFSLPTSLGQKCTPLYNSSEQSQLIQRIIWMLQHHLLLQLHMYIQYLPTDQGHTPYNLDQTRSTPLTPIVQSNSTLSSRTFSITPSRQSRTHSESDASVISDTPEPRPDSELGTATMNSSLANVSFSSADEEKQEYQELLLDFSDDERNAIFKIPAASNPEDLNLFARLCRNGYFRGDHHVEEIMYLENLRRSQLLQLLDKFRDVLITYETEDPAIAMFS
ncbi:hypothetical protein PPYR_13882 [Photinus pyralis]|uniref:GATOR complex protein NPRL3 n=1 Tax=Photinus pyralis TaxID=7054 RepID=A0A1Y1MU55_PHOPY|nr:GATOR complex protein NPRL3 [Photinus pyralis]KAB0794262.1 hypothetical protein PPYR_13882 [Photinus pyralis]